MRRLVSGIALVTTRHDDMNQGIAVTSVTALTAEPPTLLVCINRSASCHDAIAAAERFCVSILSSDHSDLLAVFATSSRRADRFAEDRWIGPGLAPLRLANALAVFDCRVAQIIAYGTHSIVIGTVQEIALHEQQDALVYFEGRATAVARRYLPSAVRKTREYLYSI